jgi:endoglucanase
MVQFARLTTLVIILLVAGLAANTLTATPVALRLTGVNIAGAEFNGRALPGRPATDYFYPSKSMIDHFAAKGINTIRLPFLWERLQPVLAADLDPGELKRLDDVVQYATGRGLHVVLDVHNYAAYRRQPIGTADVSAVALADLWRRIAQHFKGNRNTIFGLMNEPKGLKTETWLEAANSAIAAIRHTGATNLILVPGNGWTGAHSWMGRSYGTPNAEVMLGVADPANNYAFEVHQYLDKDYSGTHPECRNEQIGVTTLEKFTQWLRNNGKRGFLGEFGGGSDPVCLAALDAMLTYLAENSEVWLGWTYWAAGFWPPSYFTSVQPVNGEDRPQMSVLLKHVVSSSGRAVKK